MILNKYSHLFCRVLIVLAVCVIAFPATATAQDTANTSDPAAEMERIRARIEYLNQELETIESEPEPAAAGEPAELLDLSIEQLMEISIPSPASLTQTTKRLVPATVTTITQEEIRRSGARSMYEVLEMFVPNLQIMFAREHPKAIGLRGIMEHRSDKFLLLVNGRIMNERTDFGVLNEVDLPMLGDIHHINVIRGPSSALYGPGAMSMTIDVVTENYQTFQGDEITVRGGAIDEYGTVEYKHGRKLDKNKGIFFYAGVSHYEGSDVSDSPVVFGSEEPMLLRESGSWSWHSYPGTEYTRHWFKNLNEMPFDKPMIKLFTEYTDDGFDLWGRYTQGGQWIDFTQWHDTPMTWTTREFPDEGLIYTQATVQASYDQEINSDFSIKYVMSFDRLTIENENFERAYFRKSYMEDELYGKVVANWQPAKNHSFAFGAEVSYEEFGKELSGPAISNQPFLFHYPPNQADADADNWIGYMPQWSTTHPALFGEYQWNINELFTFFASGRLDWHPYTEMMFSPRGVLVFTPNDKDTFKLMASRSARTNTASQMWIDYHYYNEESRVDVLESLEFRYERQHTENLMFGGSVFWNYCSDMLGDTSEVIYGTSSGTKVVGDVALWGFELEASYKKDKFKIDLSHSYTKLVWMDPVEGITWQNTSASVFDYGSDLAQWDNHLSKLRAEYGLTDKLTINGALCVYWGSPGGQDQANYRNSLFPDWDYDTEFHDPFEPSAYLNLGAEYKWSKNTTFQITGYNLLGLVDKDLNKRRVGFDRQLPGRYRIQPVSVGVSFTHKF